MIGPSSNSGPVSMQPDGGYSLLAFDIYGPRHRERPIPEPFRRPKQMAAWG